MPVYKTRTPPFALLRRLMNATLSLGIIVGCSESSTGPDNQSPTAGFTQSCTNLMCVFDASSSRDSDGSVVSYAWNFGDGASGTEATPSHTYPAGGAYTATLTVTDDDGASGVVTHDVVVTAGQALTAAFTSNCSNVDCEFDASSSSAPQGAVVTYGWDFGDGSSGTGQTTTHAYSSFGTFTVMLTAMDALGTTATDTQQITLTSPFTQLGVTIPGLTATEQFGRAVAMSDNGDRIVAGAPNSSAGGTLSGQVRAFEWNGTAWVQLGQNIDGSTTSLLLGADKGITMSGDGQRIAVGAARSGAGSVGSVRVYELSGGTWVQLGGEIIPAATSQFGTAVSLSRDGSRLAVGGPLGGGRVEVYDLVAGSWVQMGASLLGTIPDRLGFDVSLSADGTRLLASAQGAQVGSNGGAGKLKVYDWSGSAWVQVGGDIDGRDGFGLNASMSRDGRRVVGYAALSGDYAAVYELVGGSWVQMGSDFTVPGAFDIYQNVDLSASGDRVAIGAMFDAPNGHGSVRVYDWDGANWNPVGLGATGPHQSAHLGWSVSISADGSRVAAGVQNFDNGNPGSNPGGVAIYSIN